MESNIMEFINLHAHIAPMVHELAAISGNTKWAEATMATICNNTINYKCRVASRRELELLMENRTASVRKSYYEIQNEIAGKVQYEAECFFREMFEIARTAWVAVGMFDTMAAERFNALVARMLPNGTKQVYKSVIDPTGGEYVKEDKNITGCAA